jgi:hypothetical protein
MGDITSAFKALVGRPEVRNYSEDQGVDGGIS